MVGRGVPIPSILTKRIPPSVVEFGASLASRAANYIGQFHTTLSVMTACEAALGLWKAATAGRYYNLQVLAEGVDTRDDGRCPSDRLRDMTTPMKEVAVRTWSSALPWSWPAGPVRIINSRLVEFLAGPVVSPPAMALEEIRRRMCDTSRYAASFNYDAHQVLTDVFGDSIGVALNIVEARRFEAPSPDSVFLMLLRSVHWSSLVTALQRKCCPYYRRHAPERPSTSELRTPNGGRVLSRSQSTSAIRSVQRPMDRTQAQSQPARGNASCPSSHEHSEPSSSGSGDSSIHSSRVN